jgi:hypothetical protein
MNSHEEYEFTQCMTSHEEFEFMQCMNSQNDMNLSEYINSHNDKNSSDYMNSHVPLCVFVPDKELNCLTGSHIKLNSLDDMQECLSNSNHKMAFDYDKDTVSLVEELTFDTLEVLLFDNTIPSAGNATIAFEYHCYEIEADAPQFNYHGQRLSFQNKNCP